MTQEQQQAAFQKELDDLIDRYREEFDLTYPSLVGVLYLTANMAANEREEED
tara:strand:- start:14270 stop:14425 length:156 start_codon:yes stop_codon:yes gene_type:complete